METTRFDASGLLDTPARRAAYLSAAFETGDVEEIRDALGVLARARGLADIARDAHLSRTSPYKALGGNGNPEFGTVVRVLATLGIRLTATPVRSAPARAGSRQAKPSRKSHGAATSRKPRARKRPEAA